MICCVRRRLSVPVNRTPLAFDVTGVSNSNDYVLARPGNNVSTSKVYGNAAGSSFVIETNYGNAPFNLIFTPSVGWDGAISNISVKLVTRSKSVITIKDKNDDVNQNNTNALEVRATYGGNGANIGIGNNSLESNLTGLRNTAVGSWSLTANTTGSDNSAFGRYSLTANTTGTYNASFGGNNLSNNYSGSQNAGFGFSSLEVNTTGSYNSTTGYRTLHSNTVGNYNSAVGFMAGTQDGVSPLFEDPASQYFNQQANLNYATAIGSRSVVQQDNSIVLGRVGDGTSSSTTGQTKVGIGTTVPLNDFSVSPVYYNTGTASQFTTTITGASTTWTSAMVGMQFIFANGVSETISGFTDATHLTASVSQTVTSQVYRIHTGGFNVTNSRNAFYSKHQCHCLPSPKRRG